MLKKLAKYGNSTTLVIDKAILELLNMNESSIVKLHTDGKSLIITPANANEQDQKISYSSVHEAFYAAKESFMKKKNLEVKPLTPKIMDEATKQEMNQAFKDLFQKYSGTFLHLSELGLKTEYQEAINALASSIDPVTQSEAYIQAVNNLNEQFCPELKNLNAEKQEIVDKYASYTE